MTIHRTAILGNNVKIGKNVTIGPYSIIGDNVEIGDNTAVYSHVIIGTPGESIHDVSHENSGVTIGKNCVIREFTTINSNLGPVKTKIGDSCYLMTKSHVGHDAILEKNVVLCTGAKIGGHATVGAFTYVGLNACTHQHSSLGKYCIVGALGFFKGVSPDAISWMGVPSTPKKVNIVNLIRNIDDPDQIEKIRLAAQDFIKAQEK